MLDFHKNFSVLDPLDGPERKRTDRIGLIIQTTLELIPAFTLVDMKLKALAVDAVLKDNPDNRPYIDKLSALKAALQEYDLVNTDVFPKNRAFEYFAVLALLLVEQAIKTNTSSSLQTDRKNPKNKIKDYLSQAEDALAFAKECSAHAVLEHIDYATSQQIQFEARRNNGVKANKIRQELHAPKRDKAIEIFRSLPGKLAEKNVSAAAKTIASQVWNMEPRLLSEKSAVKTISGWLYDYKKHNFN